MERNRAAITETEWLKNYLIEFPRGNHVATTNDPFWPDEYIANTSNVQQAEEPGPTSNFVEEQEIQDMLANLPQVQSRMYFGPANLEARWIATSGASTSREYPRPRTGGIGGQWPYKTLILRSKRAETHSQHLIRTRTLELGHLLRCALLKLEEK